MKKILLILILSISLIDLKTQTPCSRNSDCPKGQTCAASRNVCQ